MNIAGLRGMGTRFFSYVRDSRVPLWRKLAGVMAVVYFLSPVDALPDVLPILGWLDDIGVLSAAAFFMVREVQRHRPGVGTDGMPLDEEGRSRLPSSVRKSV
ncbi:YkvA family protein [Myxococcus sp. RHSTA-1-4]|uniref:YkvA family protein n=1 Tax=Myxococcus sp. RHSTA-1-4 TaxID=2874601 RepID=UPI001CBAD4E9|nr:DUF1232 domain-containing protein [Myxococcus sp. RHSTA-1-4]MBZ4418733.1 DUF1232 domain-containing protein [Myxococcus sp. RHSTA-1-4]